MRTIARAPIHEVALHRPEGEIIIRLRPPPLAHRSIIETVYPPPVRYVNGAEAPNRDAQGEYSALLAFVLLADVLEGEDKPAAEKPAPAAGRAAWDAYARAIKAEFEAAGYVEGDVTALIRGYNTASAGQGRPVGKAEAPSSTPAGA